MTEDELIEMGKDLRTRWDGGWRIDGRPISNIEMVAMNRLAEKERDGSIDVRAEDGTRAPGE